MVRYDIDYEILNYTKYNSRLEKIQNNPNNKYKVVKEDNLGFSKCGFPIKHYSIGTGKIHVVFMGGAHGNEIIGVDYVTQLMKNIALGKGAFARFDPSIFTIDFIPCQNPEGFFTTTYALTKLFDGKNEEEIERTCRGYWECYCLDDYNVINLNKILDDFSINFNLEHQDIKNIFWHFFNNRVIKKEQIKIFLNKFTNIESDSIDEFIDRSWQERLNDKVSIPPYRLHQQFFKGVTLNCIPEIDNAHKKLKESLRKIYRDNRFPIETLANFFSNSEGVNLNDNNEFYFKELKEKIEHGKIIYGPLRENNLSKSIPGPVGMPNLSFHRAFTYTNENLALLNFLAKQDELDENFCFINCHSTGGVLYIYPVDDPLDKDKKIIRDFKFYINNRLATEYTKCTGHTYEKRTGEYKPYQTMGYPDRITGVGDLLRKKYTASFILELSKMGGNPIGPYGDKNGNYMLTMESNMDATMNLLDTILELKSLYNQNYEMTFTEDGKVNYEIKLRKK